MRLLSLPTRRVPSRQELDGNDVRRRIEQKLASAVQGVRFDNVTWQFADELRPSVWDTLTADEQAYLQTRGLVAVLKQMAAARTPRHPDHVRKEGVDDPSLVQPAQAKKWWQW